MYNKFSHAHIVWNEDKSVLFVSLHARGRVYTSCYKAMVVLSNDHGESGTIRQMLQGYGTFQYPGPGYLNKVQSYCVKLQM